MALNLTELAPQLINMASGLSSVHQGASLSILGGDISAQAFRQAGVASIAAAKYNAAISQLNFDRQMDNLTREIRDFTAQQHVEMASTGFRPDSKSFLNVANQTLNTFERAILRMRTSETQAQKAILFEGQAGQVAFENQARAAEYSGQVAASNAEAGAFSSIAKSFTSLGSMFGGGSSGGDGGFFGSFF